MKQIPLDELRVEYLRKGHVISLFRCSNDDLNDYPRTWGCWAKRQETKANYFILEEQYEIAQPRNKWRKYG